MDRRAKAVFSYLLGFISGFFILMTERKDPFLRKCAAQSVVFSAAWWISVSYTHLVNEDGTPYGIPVSPVLEGRNLYFHCALEGRKLENIKNNPSVCVACVGKTKLVPEKFTTEYQSAVAFGTASICLLYTSRCV